MNLDLYSSEFRNFKYLKLSPEYLARFKTMRTYRNRVQNWHDTYSADFEWPHSVEFAEQIFDLSDDALYIISPGALSSKNEYEEATLIVVEKPVILDSNPLIFHGYQRAVLEDVPHIENELNAHYCLVEGTAFSDDGSFRPDSRIIRVNSLPIVPKQKAVDFTAIFYDKNTAEIYRRTLTEMFRHTSNAMSAFSARL